MLKPSISTAKTESSFQTKRNGLHKQEKERRTSATGKKLKIKKRGVRLKSTFSLLRLQSADPYLV